MVKVITANTVVRSPSRQAVKRKGSTGRGGVQRPPCRSQCLPTGHLKRWRDTGEESPVQPGWELEMHMQTLGGISSQSSYQRQTSQNRENVQWLNLHGFGESSSGPINK